MDLKIHLFEIKLYRTFYFIYQRTPDDTNQVRLYVLFSIVKPKINDFIKSLDSDKHEKTQRSRHVNM